MFVVEERSKAVRRWEAEWAKGEVDRAQDHTH